MNKLRRKNKAPKCEHCGERMMIRTGFGLCATKGNRLPFYALDWVCRKPHAVMKDWLQGAKLWNK